MDSKTSVCGGGEHICVFDTAKGAEEGTAKRKLDNRREIIKAESCPFGVNQSVSGTHTAVTTVCSVCESLATREIIRRGELVIT